ncbi:MAG: aminotransferase class V-fold PLP-dependent enzyme [Ruminococcus sp.]|nr:aminotransferase class V-fold PLP-dependent enzyme [Ruminococcus sp.]MCM1382484.1 aminotransferase class V-fold PLP-dependent enzyme [Muribaculaceae bacterium]MCM1480493.1 aminotransferase class V-fold PLP-dependent enzyme [Muribaculaceae bacterium]
MINFDNSATTFPKPDAVKKALLTAVERYGGNPGRSGHKISIDTAGAVYKARTSAADFFAAEPDNTVFAQNCTHALNMAIKGVAEKGCHIIISSLEHNAVARPVHALYKQGVCTYSIAEITPDDGRTLENFERLITPQTKIIACTLGSNVTGQILPFEEIGRLCRKNNICFIADGAQACGVIPVKLSDGINILCTAGHKALYGPAGTGLLITDGKYKISPIMEGGTGSLSMELDQPDFLPDALEAGTVNTCGAIALGAGIDFVKKLGTEKIYSHETELCRKFIYALKPVKNVTVYRDERVKNYLPVASFNIEGISANETAAILSDVGFALRGGLHCSGLAHASIGTVPDGTVRFSPSVFNTAGEVDALIYAVKKIAQKYEKK